MSIEQFLFLIVPHQAGGFRPFEVATEVASVTSCSINCRFEVQRRPFTAQMCSKRAVIEE